MKAFLLLILSCAAVYGQESRLQYVEDVTKTAKRYVGNQVFNAALQTSLWKTVTATYIRPQVYTGGWVVKGKIDETNAVFVLKNPPTEELQRFNNLRYQYVRVKADYDVTLGSYEETKRAHEDAKLRVSTLKSDPPTRVGTKQEARWIRDLNSATNDEEVSDRRAVILNAKVKNLKAQLDDLESSGFDFSSAVFTFSCPAVKLTQIAENLPVYDRGRIIQYQ